MRGFSVPGSWSKGRSLAALAALWRRRPLRWLLLLALLALLVGKAALLVVAVLLAAALLVRPLFIRLFDSVRAKLTAFYLYAAMLPILLLLGILLFMGYVVLGHASAQVVERRLEALSHWMERRADAAESSYWRLRAKGVAAETAAPQALASSLAGLDSCGVVWWVTRSGEMVAQHGDLHGASPLEPGWLGGRNFAGLVLRGPMRLELRLHRPLGEEELHLGAMLPLTTGLLDGGPPVETSRLAGGLGPPGRALGPDPEGPVSRRGVRTWLAPVESQPDTSGVTLAKQQELLRAVATQSRFPAFSWDYRGHPVDWLTGGTDASGPPVFIAFSLEAATRALLRTSFETIEVIAIVVLVVAGFVILLQIVATFRGFAYAQSIAGAVSRLDRGVRALRAGDFGTRIQPRESDQLGRLALAFNDMSERLQELMRQQAEHESFERELAIARSVQQRLFPERVPELPFLEANGICLPARMVSGDYYDFIPIPGGCDALIADVSGKGMSAALLMASVHAALRSQYPGNGGSPPDPGALLTRLNRHLHESLEPTRFVTLLLVRVLEGGRLLYGNAGHNPALLLRGDRVEWLRAGGLLLGPFGESRFESTRLEVESGDLLCLYTDGVTEAVGPEGEQFGEQRLAETLRQSRHLEPRMLQEHVVRQVRQWQGEAEAGDDLTLVVLRFKGA